MPDVWERKIEKQGQNWKTLIFPGKSEAIVPVLPWKFRSPYFTHS